ncbi:MAG: host attachment protein, partial [Alphaproteobacteria bacterium]|nr:host attachment protein [Alphaproteobacteria bacterium]
MTKSVMKPRRKAKLPQAPPMEPRHKRTLIVVADGARARFFEPRQEAHTLVPAELADLLAPQSRLPNREIVTDRPGRGAGTSAAATHRRGLEPPHDPHKLEKHNFTAALARDALSPQVKNMVSHRVPRDLTKSSPQALWQALE